MIEAGKLIITLNYTAGKVQQVNIQSTRPLHINRLFIGKTPEQTLTLLPLLFNVCGIAQAFAAFTALSHTLGIEENPKATLARQLLVSVEMLREHGWWLLINRDKTQLAPFIQFLNHSQQALFVNSNAFSLTSQLQIDFDKLDFLINQLAEKLDDIFSGQRLAFLAIKNADDLQEWLKNNVSIPAQLLNELFELQYQRLGRAKFSLLPELTKAQLNEYIAQQNADEFSRAPTWQNQCYETSCLNRQSANPFVADLLHNYGNGLLTRFAARLLELANLPNRIKQNAAALKIASPLIDSKSCLAQVQTSRGLLIHRVELNHGVIKNYQIIAPTEWNFHPRGVAALSLQQLTAPNTTLLQQQANLIINALDPCVSFEVLIEE